MEHWPKTIYEQMRAARVKSHFFRVFTGRPEGGNPARVIFVGELDDRSLWDITREHDIVMTVFVMPSENADARFRFFTPKTEMSFCGHGILAGACAYAAKEHRAEFTVETDARAVSLRVTDGSLVQFKTAGEVSLQEIPSDRDEVARLVGLRPQDLDETAPLCVASIGSPKLLIPVAGLQTLLGLKPDLEAIAAWSARYKVNGVYAYSLETANPQAVAHARAFNPLFNENEDAATGVAAGALVAALARTRELPNNCMVEQGPVLSERNQIWVSVEPDGVNVGGYVMPMDVAA